MGTPYEQTRFIALCQIFHANFEKMPTTLSVAAIYLTPNYNSHRMKRAVNSV